MKNTGFDIEVNITEPDMRAYERALRAGDLAALKQVLLGACTHDQKGMIEKFLPAKLIGLH